MIVIIFIQTDPECRFIVMQISLSNTKIKNIVKPANHSEDYRADV